MYLQKKENILTRRKIQFFLKPVFVIAAIFIIYQLIMFIQLTNVSKQGTKPHIILGTHEQQQQLYTPDAQGLFTCVVSMEKIDFNMVNDDYCDCQDGSDEPGTNACPNGQFFCLLQVNYKHYPKLIPSSKVNDGICDCCDGSDEWVEKKLPFRLEDKLQCSLMNHQSPCLNLCGP